MYRHFSIVFFLIFLNLYGCGKPFFYKDESLNEDTRRLFFLKDVIDTQVITNCFNEDYIVLGREFDSESCNGINGCNSFKLKKDNFDGISNYENIKLISSWPELEKIKEVFDSKLINGINKSDFKNYIYGIVVVSFTGLDFIENEEIILKNGKIYFHYEVWTETNTPVPQCLWSNLYVFRLSRCINGK